MVGSRCKLYSNMKISKEDGTLTDLGTVPTKSIDVVTADNSVDDVDVLVKKAMKNNKGEDALQGGYRVDNKPDGTLYVESPEGNCKISIEQGMVIFERPKGIERIAIEKVNAFSNAINYLVQANAGDA